MLEIITLDETKSDQKGLDYVNRDIPAELKEDLMRFHDVYHWSWQLIKGVLKRKYGLSLNRAQLQEVYDNLLTQTEAESSDDTKSA